MTLTATFDWPPKALSPNSRCHWAKKAKAVKAYRRDSFLLAIQQKLAADWEGEIHLHMAFSPPDNRRRDWDNMLASAKPLCDGLADALGINDRLFRHHLAVLPPRKGGAVIVALSRGV